jgi:hypothetical protein
LADAAPAREQLHDLRLLYLAHEVEHAFEGLEKALERHLPAGRVRELLEPLFKGGPGHSRLETELDRLNRAVESRRADVEPEQLLLALADCERMAQDFYARHAAALSDPALAELFRGLAKEEGRHLRAVEEALALQRSMG